MNSIYCTTLSNYINAVFSSMDLVKIFKSLKNSPITVHCDLRNTPDRKKQGLELFLPVWHFWSERLGGGGWQFVGLMEERGKAHFCHKSRLCREIQYCQLVSPSCQSLHNNHHCQFRRRPPYIIKAKTFAEPSFQPKQIAKKRCVNRVDKIG